MCGFCDGTGLDYFSHACPMCDGLGTNFDCIDTVDAVGDASSRGRKVEKFRDWQKIRITLVGFTYAWSPNTTIPHDKAFGLALFYSRNYMCEGISGAIL